MNADIFSELEESKIDGLSNEQLKALIDKMKSTKVNVLLVGGTGVGKSSTINALFKMQKAKVGQSTEPETMEISAYHLDNLVIWDTPGFGDSSANDMRYKAAIEKKIIEQDEKKQFLIDLVILILDGSSRDYSSAYTIIKDVIYPNLGVDAKNRLLIAINQADMAMKGRYWNHDLNQPEIKLIEFLDEKVRTTQTRIQKDTGLDIEPIYYSAGFKDSDEVQYPYNLSKLLSHILSHLPDKKRISVFNDINENAENFENSDNQKDYRKEIESKFQQSLWANILDVVSDVSRAVLETASTAIKVVKETAIEVLQSEAVRKAAMELISDLIRNRGK